MYHIHIDITDLAFHKGVLSGIQRVEYHLVRHYLKDKRANFLCWSDRHAQFVSLLSDDVNKLISSIDQANRALTSRPSSAPQQTGSLRQIGRGYITRLSGCLRRQIKNWPKLYDWLLRFRRNHFFNKKHVTVCHFKAGDKLLIACGFWGHEAYMGKLKDLNELGINISQVVHDMIPVIMPQTTNDNVPQSFVGYMQRVLPIASQIIGVSKNTTKDIQQVLKVWGLETRASYILFRLGDDSLVHNVKPKRPIQVKSEPYFLAVGTLEPRKNHRLLLQTYKLAQENSIDLPHLYLAGRRGWGASELLHDLNNNPVLTSKVTLVEGPTDAELDWLYRQARLTIFPSFYEGWGLPIAESLTYGKITLASKTSSMPEIGGQLVDYFSPNSPEELLRLLIKYSNQAEHKSRQAEIQKVYKIVPWSTAVQRLANELDRSWGQG